MKILRFAQVLLAAATISVPTTGDLLAIQNGSPDEGRHPYVGVLFTNWAFVGGATMVLPGVAVATGRAGHIIEYNRDHLFPQTSIFVNFDPDHPATAENSVPVVAMHVFPGYVFQAEHAGGSREGLLEITVLILDPTAAAPGTILPEPVGLPELGILDRLLDRPGVDDVEFVGTGSGPSVEFGRGGPVSFEPGSRRTALLDFRSLGHDEIYFDQRPPRDDGGICLAGDDGGSLNAVVGGEEIFVGILIKGGQFCHSPGSALRLDTEKIQEFIRSFIPAR